MPIRDTAAELRSVDKKLKENEAALEWYRDQIEKAKDRIYITIHSAEGPQSIPISKKEFEDWASTQIFIGAMTPGDITAIVNESSTGKRALLTIAKHRVSLLEEDAVKLRDRQRALAHKLDLERNHKTEPLGNSASFAGDWVGTSGKGGFREEWSIVGREESYEVTITYYRNDKRVGEAGGSGRIQNGKLRFLALTRLKPDPSWSDSVNMVATVEGGNVLVFDYNTGSASGTVSLHRK